MKLDLSPTRVIVARTRESLPPRLIGYSGLRDAAFFFVLTLILTWLFWMPAAVLDMAGLSSIAKLGFAAGSFVPLIVAGFLNFFASRRTFEWARWLRSLELRSIVLVLILPVLILAPVILARVYWGTFQVGRALSDARSTLPLLVGFTVLAFGEEVGWRGFLLARLRSLNLALVNVIIGLAWFAWQLPLVLTASGDAFAGGYPPRLAAFFVFSLLITPFFNRITLRSGMNVLLPSLFRASLNTVFITYLMQGSVDALTFPYGLGPLAWLFALNILLIAPLWLGKRAGGPLTELEIVMPFEPATE